MPLGRVEGRQSRRRASHPWSAQILAAALVSYFQMTAGTDLQALRGLPARSWTDIEGSAGTALLASTGKPDHS
jgi:hypothetical protein